MFRGLDRFLDPVDVSQGFTCMFGGKEKGEKGKGKGDKGKGKEKGKGKDKGKYKGKDCLLLHL